MSGWHNTIYHGHYNIIKPLPNIIEKIENDEIRQNNKVVRKNLKNINLFLQNKNLPIQLRKLILQKTYDIELLAEECYNNPELMDICKEYKEIICKDTLNKYGYNKYLEEWENKYCYLIKNILKLTKLISYNKNITVKLSNKEYIIAYLNSESIIPYSHSNKKIIFKEIPLDVLDFINKNNNYVKVDPGIITLVQKILNVNEKSFLNENDKKVLRQIFRQYYIPTELKIKMLNQGFYGWIFFN